MTLKNIFRVPVSSNQQINDINHEHDSVGAKSLTDNSASNEKTPIVGMHSGKEKISLGKREKHQCEAI